MSVDYYSGAWNGAYQKLEKTYPIAAGTKVHALVEVTVPYANQLSPKMLQRLTEGQGCLTIAASNLTELSATVKCPGYAAVNLTFDAYDEASQAINDGACGKTFTVEIWGTTVKSTSDVEIEATLGVYNTWVDDQFKFFGLKNDKEYTIFKGTGFGDYVVTRSNDTDTGVRFFTKSNGQLENAQVVLDGNVYQIVNSFDDPAINFVPYGGTYNITGDELRDVKAVLDDVLGNMGFEYSGRAYITVKLINKNLGTIAEGSAKLVYPAGYIAELVTDDPSVNPPQTGDNASVVGFVMIAVALVAAAAVTVKKVRA
ncbi:MAG: hypothetical protein PUD73_07230 [bacterium]|nr:hypothetical protein [bacterium]